MTKYDFPWPLTSYRHLFLPSRAYFQEVTKDPLNQTDNIFCNFAAFRKDEDYLFVGVYTNIFIHQLALKVSKYKVAKIQEWYRIVSIRSVYTSNACTYKHKCNNNGIMEKGMTLSCLEFWSVLCSTCGRLESPNVSQFNILWTYLASHFVFTGMFLQPSRIVIIL